MTLAEYTLGLETRVKRGMCLSLTKASRPVTLRGSRDSNLSRVDPIPRTDVPFRISSSVAIFIPWCSKKVVLLQSRDCLGSVDNYDVLTSGILFSRVPKQAESL